ncbi:DNA-binding response regulator, NarL/FixJ family, contains REC and HTH domains [Micromonospora viridifaciens]|uniref:DNA-binding response regulator, NarL/FixJ family, contains REC and HTH domains n=1 Tax=Micromonospora viridifaciens TaxID=1881 RepID=A0A1C4WU09_MICVI|nr:response regulator transcription factor [Micromonospora viridifaciens]SCE99786.1 DNA-binding response regulator, NarL/FixJ family, contains REC and HTH domains [Micromonospora viridifaciens]
MQEVSVIHCPRRAEGLAVLVSIDNELTRCGLSQMLADLAMVATVEAGGGPQATARLLETGAYQIVIVSADGSLGGTDLVLAAAARSGTSSLFLLRTPEDALLPEVAALSVDGFLLEPGLNRTILADSLHKLTRGEMPIPGSLARRILDELRHAGKPRSDPPFMLTPRERQALKLLAEGLSNKQIARRLGISEHGAKRHVGNVLAKLNCPNRTVAVTVALNHGLLTEETTQPPDPAVVNLRRRIVSAPEHQQFGNGGRA